MYQIAPARFGEGGYVGYCDGRVIARADRPELVVRAILAPGGIPVLP